MRLVMVCRKYSGIGREVWSPAGTPAVTKLIEILEARGIATTVLFLAKSPQMGTSDLATDYGRFKHVRFVHLAWRGLPGAPAILSELINSARQFVRVAPYIFGRADVLYFDRGHLAFAALASLFHRRVVWRCLGVMSFLLARDAGKWMGTVYLWLARLLVRFPIRLTICTNDGSPWYRLFRGRRVRQRLILATNGIDRTEATECSYAPPPMTDVSQETVVPIIGFVGRATVAKGVDVFVDACANLARRGTKFRAVVVGDGADRSEAETKARDAGLSGIVRFAGAIPHAEIECHLATMRIYVSPALHGGFSNTMLEALASGCCVVAFEPDRARGVDLTTSRFLPEGVVKWIGRADPAAGIADAVHQLLTDPEQCQRRRGAARQFARSELSSWDERLTLEVRLLEQLANGGSVPTGAMPGDRLAEIAQSAGER